MTRENKAGLAMAGVFLALVGTVGMMKWRDVPGQRSLAMSVPPAVEMDPESSSAAKPEPKVVEQPNVVEVVKAIEKPQVPLSPKVNDKPTPPKPAALPSVDVVGQLNGTTLPGTTPPSPEVRGEPLKAIDPKRMDDEDILVFQGPPAPPLSSDVLQVKNETPMPAAGLPGVSAPAVLPPSLPGVSPPAPENVPPTPVPKEAPIPGVGDLTPPVPVSTPTASAAPTPPVVAAPKIESIPPTPPGVGATLPGVGATPPGTGSALPGVGATPPGVGATPPGVGSTPPGMGATLPGVGSTSPGMGATPTGVGATLPGVGATPPGIGSSLPGVGSNPPGVIDVPTPPSAVMPPTPAGTPPAPPPMTPGIDLTPPPAPGPASVTIEPIKSSSPSGPTGLGTAVPVPSPSEIKVEPPPMNPLPATPIPSMVKASTEKTTSGAPVEGSRFVPAVTVAAPRPLGSAPPMASSIPGPKSNLELTGSKDSASAPVKPPVGSTPPADLRPADPIPTISVPAPSGLPLTPVPSPQPAPAQPNDSRSTLPSSSLPSARTSVVQIGGGIASAAPKGQKVIRYDTHMHLCKQEDTWDSISTQRLLSKKWAEALRAFNMQYRGQNERVRATGAIQSGDTVFVPPAQVLLADFPSLIRE